MKTRAPTTTSPVRRAARPSAIARKPATGAQAANAEAVRTILRQVGAQPQVAVSTPGDTFEREADRVADRISAGLPAPLISRLPSTSVDRAAKRDPEEKKKRAQRKETKKPEDDSKKRAQRKETKKPEDDSKKRAQRKEASAGPTLEDTAERAIGSKGAGRPLDPATRATLESGMGVDLGAVRVHDDAASRSAAQALNARAFTHGNDIWLGPGESQRDTRLMAHEATHVVQQQSEMTQRLVQRDETPPAGGGTAMTPERAEQKLRTFKLPPVKQRHLARYRSWSNLVRVPGYPFNRGEPNQGDVWRAQVALPDAELQRLHLGDTFTGTKTLLLNRATELTGTRAELLDQLLVPYWGNDFVKMDNRLEVDHIVELQVGNWNGVSGPANELANMELLDKSSNASAGSGTRLSIRENVQQYLQDTGRPFGRDRVNAFLQAPRRYAGILGAAGADTSETPLTEGIRFTQVEVGAGETRASKFWSVDQIRAGEHLRRVYPLGNPGEHGRADSYALVSPSGRVVLGQYAHPVNGTTISVTNENDQRRIGGLRITEIVLNPDYANAADGTQVGTIQATLESPNNVETANTALSLTIKRVSQYSGSIEGLPATIAASTPALSPIEFSGVQLDGPQLVATGRLSPTIPLLSSVPLELQLRGRDIQLAFTYSPENLELPIPGVSIDDCSLSLFYGTRGFGAEGAVAFSVDGLGAGRLTAAITTERGFEASGRFSFDRRLFDRAEIEVWYRNRAFGGRGTIGIDNPNKIRGIRSAEVTVGYDAGVFSATGRVSPSIRGVQEAGLTITYSEAEGLIIGGNLQLTNEIPGIRSGSIDVTLRKQEEAWKVSATGRAQPAIPGIDSELTVAYDDGAFSATFSGAFQRGMLSGTANIGVTNRTLDASGQPTGDPDPGAPLIVYGGGSATVQIAPWLQGTAGLQFAPNGEVTLSGEIGLPSQIEIFSRKQIDRSLLNIAVQVPIFPGIVAEIGGGLSAQAGIGPGVIDQLRIGITYNPAHEDQTHVTGDAHLNIPADAGLRLAVRAGIGLGITGASATGGLEIGGMLGIGGAAEAGVHLDWTPATGLTIDAHGELHAEPVFRFDISGYVSVRALGFSIYDQRWELASYEFGSNLRFGVRFPIHYVQGQPFDISLSDVEFTVPEVNPRQLLEGLIERIA